MIEQLWVVLLGFVAGMLGSMIGLGGGIIMVPVLTFAGFMPSAAVSTSLFGVLSGSISSTVSYSRRVGVDYGLALRLGLPGVPGAVLGATLAAGVRPDLFQALFATVMILAAVYLLMKRRIEVARVLPRQKKSMMMLAMGVSFLAGIASAFFGIGGGLVLIPLMVIGMGMTMKQAAPISMMALIVTASSGVLAHTALGHPEFLHAGLLVVGCFAGGLAGAGLNMRMKETRLRMAAAAFILLAAAKLIYGVAVEGVALGMIPVWQYSGE